MTGQPKTIIAKEGNNYFFIDNFEEASTLPVGSYRLNFSDRRGYFLSKLEHKEPPKKRYSNDSLFIEHVMNSVSKTSEKNIGILLTGVKGLGKSFTANYFCDNMNLPVIKIDTKYSVDMFHFLNSITCPHIIYIDEFEKLYPIQGEGNAITQEKFLSFLDGGMSNDIKKIFIITTNSAVNDLFINRPSRLKYIRKYHSLDDAVIQEIIDDLLENKEFASDLINNLESTGLNIDILIKIIEEINLTGQPYSQFKDFFNFNVERKTYDIHLVDDEGASINLTSRAYTDTELDNVLKGKGSLSFYNLELPDGNTFDDDHSAFVSKVVESKYADYLVRMNVPVYLGENALSKLSEKELEEYNDEKVTFREYTFKFVRKFVSYVF